MFSLLGFSYITLLYRVFLMFGLLGLSYIMVLYRVSPIFSGDQTHANSVCMLLSATFRWLSRIAPSQSRHLCIRALYLGLPLTLRYVRVY